MRVVASSEDGVDFFRCNIGGSESASSGREGNIIAIPRWPGITFGSQNQIM
jgi:hypothetical protein